MSILPSGILARLDDPWQRQVVVVLDRLTFEKLDYDPAVRDRFKDAGVLALPEDLSLSSHPVLTALAVQGLWDRNAVLARNPYFYDRYAAGEPHAAFGTERLRVMVELAHLLGATSFEYEERKKTSRGRLRRVKVGGGKKPVDASGTVDRDVLDKLEEGCRVRPRFEGAPPDVAQAQDLLRRRNLDHDSVLNHLIHLRAGPNEHRSVTESFDLLEESSRTIQLAARVRAEALGEISGKAGKSARATCNLTFTIQY